MYGADIGGISELVKNDENGLTYKFDDVNELADKMKKLFEDKPLANRLGNTAKEQAIKLYSKDVYYKKIIKIYTELIKER